MDLSSTLAAPSKERTPSLRSVDSNSSISSAVSLTRRPRTMRARSRTVTGGQPDSASLRSVAAENSFFAKPLVAEPDDVLAPSRPMHSPLPQRPATADAHPKSTPTLDEQDLAASGMSEVYPAKQYSLPGIAPSKAPATTATFIVPIHDASANVRDSMLSDTSNFSQQSAVSSALYPQSTSTASGTESPPSPRSIVDPDGDMDVPIIDDLQEYDGDDVSYRLRLLVKNNYFLPPAHSKPSPSDFAASPPLNRKPNAPSFFDLFRGKNKSKPTTPVGASTPPDIAAPALRTPSDNTSNQAFTQPRNSTNPQHPTHPPSAQDRSGRVVVVREKMADLVGAAKQAEQEMKTRGGRQGSQRGQQDIFDDVIDPTDAVDLPPPSSKYPFAVQASALHGLGVEDSIGAALLADRLPPPTSPGIIDPDDDWRRALLKAAVGHSLDNLRGDATPTSPLSFMTASPTPPHLHSIGQRIINRPIMLDNASLNLSPSTRSPVPFVRNTAGRARGLSSPEAHSELSYFPTRAETPVTPLTPLSPPPRRIINPLYSLSQTDLGTAPISNAHGLRPHPPSSMPSTAQGLRKATSTPGLHYAARQTLTPPPLPVDMQRLQGVAERASSSFETSRGRVADSMRTESIYSEDDVGDIDHYSTTLSYYSQPSPTASAFQDAISSIPSGSSGTASQPLSPRDSTEMEPSTILRRDTMSPPPPRASTSTPSTALSPPPRSSSLVQQWNIPSRLVHTMPHNEAPERTPSVEILEPAPTTPPYAATSPTTPTFTLAERRNGSAPLLLHIPSEIVPVSIHSAPPPSSPPSFFDSIQSQPNAMDDLDSSSDESDEEDDDTEQTIERPVPQAMTSQPPPQARPRKITSARDSLMRLGNHSTPYVARPSLPFIGISNPARPVGHSPQTQPFFADKLAERAGPSNGASSFDFYKYARENPRSADLPSPPAHARSPPNRPATADENVQAWQHKKRDQESLRRLDGLLIQHMEAEKDTLKRIASNIQSSSSSTQP